MIQPVIGIIGGSGLYDIDGLEDKGLAPRRNALGRAVRRTAVRTARRHPVRVPAAPRTGASDLSDASELSGEYRCAEAVRRDRCAVAVGSRQPARGSAAGAFRHRRPVHRPQLRAGKELLRRRHRRPCLHGASGLRAAGRCAARRLPAALAPAGHPRRHLSGDGRPAILHQGGERALPVLGLFASSA